MFQMKYLLHLILIFVTATIVYLLVQPLNVHVRIIHQARLSQSTDERKCLSGRFFKLTFCTNKNYCLGILVLTVIRSCNIIFIFETIWYIYFSCVF